MVTDLVLIGCEVLNLNVLICYLPNKGLIMGNPISLLLEIFMDEIKVPYTKIRLSRTFGLLVQIREEHFVCSNGTNRQLNTFDS